MAAGDPTDRVGPTQWQSWFADGVLALFAAVLLISTVTAVRALAPVAWAALSRASASNTPTDPRQCALINGDRDRLVCFDHYVKELMRPPAKGAVAPPEAFGVRKPESDARYKN